MSLHFSKYKCYLMLLMVLPFSSYGAGKFTPQQIHAAVKQAGGPEGFLRAVATNTAKTAGQMIDDQTEVTGAASTGRTLVFYVSLVNYAKADIANLQVARQRLAMRNAPAVCTAPISSVLINEYGAEYKYMAYSKNREYLFEYSLTKASCSPNYRW